MQILTNLLNNCRESDRQIGMNVGISGGAVKSRINKMLKNGIIRFFTLKIEPPALGYGVIYFVITGEDLDEILQQVKLIGEPFFVVPCVGGITVCSIVIKENVQQKLELAKNLMKNVRVLTIFEAGGSIFNVKNLMTPFLSILLILDFTAPPEIPTFIPICRSDSLQLFSKFVRICMSILSNLSPFSISIGYTKLIVNKNVVNISFKDQIY